MSVGEVVDAQREVVDAFLTLQGQVITYVHPEVGWQLEVVGMGGVIGLLFLPFLFRAQGVDWIGTAFHRLPVAAHEGETSRKAPVFGEFVLGSRIQHVPTVELEGNGIAEVQGREQPVRLGQRVGELAGEARGFHA